MSTPERHRRNAPGRWYVDTRCIDCTASRTVAPGLIVARGGQSVRGLFTGDTLAWSFERSDLTAWREVC